MKQVKAIFCAILITLAVGAALFTIGTNALANTNTVPLLNSPASSTGASDPPVTAVSTSSNNSAGSAQLTNTAVQYANRANQLAQQLNQETNKLNQETQQLNQANQQLQAYSQQLAQYQQVLIALQQNGLIQVGSDGTIYMRRAGNNNNFGGDNSVPASGN
jgi:TolA-binding protein